MRAATEAIRSAVEAALPELTKHYGGAPFISTYVYDTSLHDMDRLMPWVVVVVALVVFVSFRSIVGTVLALVSKSLSILMTCGVMGMAGTRASIVLSSMPVVLFAVGAAYPIHILCEYYDAARSGDRASALERTMRDMGPPVVAAGLITAAGFASLVAMDIAPIREFGLYSALGVLFATLLTLTFIPAVIGLTRMRGRAPATIPWGVGSAR